MMHAKTLSKQILAFDLRDLAIIALLVVPGWALMKTTGDFAAYFRFDVLDGQFLYILSKLFGLYAIVLLWAQTMYGLLARQGTGWFSVEPGSRLHRAMGMAVIVLLLAHAFLFIAGVSLRNGHFAYKLLLPHLQSGYYPMMLSFGLIAAWLLLVVGLAAGLRRRLNVVWKWLHRLSLPALILVFVHSFFIGSETRVDAMPYLYAVMVATLLAAVVFRLFRRRS